MGAKDRRAPLDVAELVDFERGLVDRRIFTDPAIYQLELRNIFARVWNFVCHESQIPTPGRYFRNAIGNDSVIAVRDREGAVRVLLNTCPHRGNSVCRADEGVARSFFCSYHGWNFDLNGDLLGVPGYDDFYRGTLDKSQWGMASAAQVQSYNGFVFATLDSEAPPLEEFLGWVGRVGLDMLCARGEIEVVPGVQRNLIQCNWKLAVDNLFDWYHPKVSHASAVRLNVLPESTLYPNDQMVLLGDYGHAIGGPGLSSENQARLERQHDESAQTAGADGADGSRRHAHAWRLREDVRERMGPVGVRTRGHPNIFPNLWVASGGTQLCLRVPRGRGVTELQWYTFVEKDMTPAERREVIQHAIHFFGPAGLLEQDDGENWSHSTRGAAGTAAGTRPLNFAMGAGLDAVRADGDQASIDTVVNEHGQRWTYQAWADWLAAPDWPSLVANHTAPPTEVI
ncbi:MAG: aromatic ring-hydroxylating dioxygenase subunit alpha [Pseudomonadota bacterium]